MHLLSRGGKLGVGFLVLEQYPIAVKQHVSDEAVRVGQRDPLLDWSRGQSPRGDGRVEDAVGGFEVLGQVHVGKVERIAVLVEAVDRSVGGKFALKRQAGKIK